MAPTSLTQRLTDAGGTTQTDKKRSNKLQHTNETEKKKTVGGCSAKAEALRLFNSDIQPVPQLVLGGVSWQKKVVEACVRGRQPVRVATILADHQRLFRKKKEREQERR